MLTKDLHKNLTFLKSAHFTGLSGNCSDFNELLFQGYFGMNRQNVKILTYVSFDMYTELLHGLCKLTVTMIITLE